MNPLIADNILLANEVNGDTDKRLLAQDAAPQRLRKQDLPSLVYSLDFDVHSHQLRHTCITNLISAQVDPKTVQYLAGHKNSKITMDIYAKAKYNQPEMLCDVVNAALRQ